MTREGSLNVLFLILVVLLGSASHTWAWGSDLTVTELPHYQTFDFWDICSWPGNCYEQACSLQDGWSNLQFTDTARNWWVHSGVTSSNIINGVQLPCSSLITGPCGDHTKNGTGNYLYVEGSACQGVTFEVTSPIIQYSNSSAQISFWYYMYGQDLHAYGNQYFNYGEPNTYFNGSLSVYMAVNGGNWTLLHTFSGQQQTKPTQAWKQYVLTLDSYFPNGPANGTHNVQAQFKLLAVAGGPYIGSVNMYWQTDIAIDDFIATQSGSSTNLTAYIPPVSPNATTTTTSSSGNPVVIVSGGGDGISGGQIAGIVAGVVGGVGLCLLALLALLISLLLLISPRKPKARPTPLDATPGAPGNEL